MKYCMIFFFLNVDTKCIFFTNYDQIGEKLEVLTKSGQLGNEHPWTNSLSLFNFYTNVFYIVLNISHTEFQIQVLRQFFL